jgi:L-lysine exporter family protein LysE/ArgO
VNPAYFQGMGMGAGLIVAIGAQNAFVLSQSIRKNHHWAVAGLCAVLDVTLIAAGVGGLGMLIASNEWLQRLSALGGALFLIWFGLSSLRSAFQDEVLEASCAGPQSLARVMAGTLAVSLLNPHVYLDTVVLLGAIGGQYAGDARLHFGLGACTASVLWFFSLALAGRAMAPLFKKPISWRLLHLAVTGLVWWVAWGLAARFVAAL